MQARRGYRSGEARARAWRSSDVLRLAMAERPVFRKHLDQIDEDILRPQPGAVGQPFDDAPIQLLLLLHIARVADGDLNDDQIVAALDAEIIRAIDEIVLVMFGDDHEAVAFGDIEGLAHGLIEAFENGFAVGSGLAPPE